MKVAIVILIAAALSLTLGCSDKPCPPEPPDPYHQLWEQVRRGDFPDAEAEHAALWISGQLMAPPDLYREIHHGLQLLRDTWRDSLPQVEIELVPAYPHPCVGLCLPPELAQRFFAGTWGEFDSLNLLYDVETVNVDTTFGETWITVYFRGRLHPELMTEIYRSVLDSTAFVWTNNVSHAYCMPNLYVWKQRGLVTFLARDCWFQWPPPWDHDYFDYFRLRSDSVEYVGSFEPGVTDVPDWWPEARVAHDLFMKFYDILCCKPRPW